MPPPLPIAIVGTGDLFHRTLVPWLGTDQGRARFRPVAVCAASIQSARAGVEALKSPCHAFDSIDAMLAGSDAPCVWVVSPAQFHAEHALAALRAGRHVYVQKPLTTQLSAFDAVASAARDASKFCAVAPGQMLCPVIREMSRLIANDAIGKPYFAVAPFIGWSGLDIDFKTDPAWRFQTGNGPLGEHGVYGITSLITLLGKPVRVSAMKHVHTAFRRHQHKTLPVTDHDNAAVIIAFESGAYATLHEAWCPGSQTSAVTRVHGLSGTLETTGGQWDVDPPAFIHRGVWGDITAQVTRQQLDQAHNTPHTPDPSPHPPNPAPLPNPHVWQDLLHLEHCIRYHTYPLNDISRVRTVYETLDAIEASASTGQHVAL